MLDLKHDTLAMWNETWSVDEILFHTKETSRMGHYVWKEVKNFILCCTLP